MKTLYGKPLAKKILDEVKEKVAGLGRTPVLSVICKNPGQPYYQGILRDARYCGIEVIDHYPIDESMDGVISLERDYVPGCDVNVDGGNMTPCTAEAIMEMLRYYKISVSGKNVCVIGRSERVGRPLTCLLLDADATVTVCHSVTEEGDLYWHMVSSDIIISCAGKANIEGRHAISQYTTVVDVGNDFDSYGNANSVIPFIGGVGPVTRAVLMRHVYLKAKEKEW